MKNKKVIAHKYLPSKAPLTSTIVYLIALDYWNAPEWLCGIVYLFIFLGWLSSIKKLALTDTADLTQVIEEEMNLLKPKPKVKSDFAKRLENAIKKTQNT